MTFDEWERTHAPAMNESPNAYARRAFNAGANQFREAGVWEPDGSKFKTYRKENLNGKAMYVKEPK